MLTLKYIKDEIQKIAEAIEAVLNIDVTNGSGDGTWKCEEDKKIKLKLIKFLRFHIFFTVIDSIPWPCSFNSTLSIPIWKATKSYLGQLIWQ